MDRYSTPHLVFIALFIVILVATALIFKYALKTDKSRDIFIRCLGILLTASVILNRVSLAVWDKNGIGGLELIPNSYCGMTNLLLGITVMLGGRNMRIFHFLFYLGFFGGLACVLYPPFLGQDPSFFFLPTISGMNHHALAVILCVIMVMGKWFEPTFKNWYVFPIGICAYTVFGLFLIDPLGIPSTMNIDEPIISGTPLKWWFVLIFGTMVEMLVTFSYDKIKARLMKKKTAAHTEPKPIEQ